MDAELKKQWVEALRSGKYEQGQQYLQKDDKFCCVGVLCDIINPESWRSAVGSIKRWEGFVDTLPYGVNSQIGLSHTSEAHLIDMNDKHEESFETIANYIERNM